MNGFCYDIVRMTHATGRPGDDAPPSEMKEERSNVKKKAKSCQPHPKFTDEEMMMMMMNNERVNKERKRKKE